MQILLVILLFAGTLIAVPITAPAQSQGPTFQELEESLTCQCGCGLTVHSCNHLQCPSAIPLRAEIREQMALDKTKSDILDHFRQTYGEKILSSPTTRGFNLLAWTLPFVGVFVGGLFIMLLVRRWVVAQRAVRAGSGAAAAPPVHASAERYQDQLDREMRDLDR